MDIAPAEEVESFLRNEKQYNIDHRTRRSESPCIDRLLQSQVAMRDVYEELLAKLPEPHHWQRLIGDVPGLAAEFSPSSITLIRESIHGLAGLNKDIAKKAEELGKLLDQRSDLANKYSIHAYDDYHPLHWMERAADLTADPQTKYLFETHVLPKLQRLRTYDRKYWPGPADLMRAAVDFAKDIEVTPTDQVTAAAISSRKRSAHDFIRALITAIEERELPVGFKLSDKALAIIANVALNLPEEDCVDAEQVKVMRSRDRKRIDR